MNLFARKPPVVMSQRVATSLWATKGATRPKAAPDRIKKRAVKRPFAMSCKLSSLTGNRK